MKILVLSGSPRKNGNTHRLVQAFSEGAQEAGHQVLHFDTAALEIKGCRACCHCRQEPNIGRCLQQDDMGQIYQAMQEAGAVVFATPLYYFGFSAQIKAAIDRFFALSGQEGGPAKTALLAVCGDEDSEVMSGLIENYRLIYSYLGMENRGEILAAGVYEIGDIEGHPALEQAKKLGHAF